jgi:hypothetical protein
MLKPPRRSYTKFVSQLQNLDQRRNWFSSHSDTTNSPFSPQLALYGQQQHHLPYRHHNNSHKFSFNGRGFQAQQTQDEGKNGHTPQQRRSPPLGERHMTLVERTLYHNEKCQYCGTTCHIAKICWWVPKKSTELDDIPQALATLTLDNTVAETKWTSDTGASNHMTSQPGMLSNIHEYYGTKYVIIGNGSSVPILGIDDTLVKQKNIVLPLNNVLFVLDLKKKYALGKSTNYSISY